MLARSQRESVDAPPAGSPSESQENTKGVAARPIAEHSFGGVRADTAARRTADRLAADRSAFHRNTRWY